MAANSDIASGRHGLNLATAVVARLDRATQYSPEPASNPQAAVDQIARTGVTGRPVKPGDDAEC
jgi:hypothetical protein